MKKFLVAICAVCLLISGCDDSEKVQKIGTIKYENVTEEAFNKFYAEDAERRNEKLNCHIKQEFYLYLNCYKWRRMDFIYQGCPEDNKKPYCIFKLKKRILHIQANAEVIKNFREIMKHFENIPAELI